MGYLIILMSCCCGAKKELTSDKMDEKITTQNETISSNKDKKSKKSPKKVKKNKELKNEGKKLKFKENTLDKSYETKPVNQSNITINESMVDGDFHELVEIDNPKAKKIKANMKNRKKNK